MSKSLQWDDVAHLFDGALGTVDAACPICAPDRPRGFRQARKVLRCWRIEDDFIAYRCVRCGAAGYLKPEVRPAARGGVLAQAFAAAERQERLADRRARVAEEAAEAGKRAAWAECLFYQAGDLQGPALAYFERRGITPGRDQRFTLHAPFGYDAGAKTAPGIVSAARDLAGDIHGVQVIHLNGDGSKISKRFFGRVMGRAIQLSPPADGLLAVSEGWENGRAFEQLYSIPTWSALSAAGLEAFEIPAGLHRLYVAADADESGRGLEAAQRLAKRASAVCEAVISLPKLNDWNDELAARGGKAAA